MLPGITLMSKTHGRLCFLASSSADFNACTDRIE
jgi:hypothetical protein